MSERCYQCFRPISLCFCAAIPRIDNRVNVLIVQHARERFHPFNTARIVHQALRDCDLIADHNQRLKLRQLPIQANACLLYPRADAPLLTELTANSRPTQLVILDGTWHHTKTMVRDVPQLRDLPCCRLTPATPGQYRIRREPNLQSLSTLEATVAALRVLEPNTPGLDQLLSAFHTMVENQLGHPIRQAVWRQKKARQSRPRNLPSALMQDPKNVVVAYGEATPGQPGQSTATRSPVNWFAQRLASGARFACCLRQQPPLGDAALEHMGLSHADFDHAVEPDEFCDRWNQFLRPQDVLVVYHQKTYQLLRQIEASQPRCLVLKSIFGRWRANLHSLEELLTAEGVTLPASVGQCRGSRRLEMAINLVQHLRRRHEDRG